MFGKTRTLDTSQTDHGVFVPSIQLYFQEPAGQGGSRQCGPSGYSSPGPNSG